MEEKAIKLRYHKTNRGRMKIAYDAKRFFQNASGLGNYSRDLVRILAEYFPENHYLLLNKKESERGASIMAKTNVEFLSFGKGKLARQLKAGKIAQERNADIFHGLSGELPLKWDKSKDIKKIVTIHDLIFMRYPEYYSFFDRKIHLWKFKKAAQTADCIIAISEQTKQDILKYLKVDASKIRVVYQGCHESFKKKKSYAELQEIKERYQLPDKFLLNVGTVEPRKNISNVIKALEGRADIPLVIVGRRTAYAERIEKEALKRKVNIRFLKVDTMEDLAGIYQLAMVFIYPSVFEGFGIPVIEALYSGTATITSNVSSLPEAGGEAALYVSPTNVEDIRSKIIFLWTHEGERQRRIEAGLKYVQKFNDEVIAQDMMKVYDEVVTN